MKPLGEEKYIVRRSQIDEQISKDTFSETKPQMVPADLTIGFQGLALIQGQIYNPDE